MNTINIMNKVAKEELWRPEGSRVEYTGHMYRNSPFETCNSCGNCDGARCEYCRKVTIPGCFSFSIYSDDLYAWMLELDVPEEIASELAYSDYCGHTYKGYHLVWPTESMLQEQYPEFYATMTTPDTEVLAVIESFRGQFRCFADLREAVNKHYGLDKWASHGHVPNQLQMYWESCNGDHDKACK